MNRGKSAISTRNPKIKDTKKIIKNDNNKFK